MYVIKFDDTWSSFVTYCLSSRDTVYSGSYVMR